MPNSPGGIPLIEAAVCFHCQRDLAGSPFQVAVHTATEDASLPLCRSCQELRQGGQLGVDLLLMQWLYAQGAREDSQKALDSIYVSLACLGCGGDLTALWAGNPGTDSPAAPSSRRLRDGSLAVACPECQRTNVLKSARGQLMAVRLW